jgi:hypothetical protein
MFAPQLYPLLGENVGRIIKEIGGLELSNLLIASLSSWD